MADYFKAASEFKARLTAKATKAAELDAFFESVRSGIHEEVANANAYLARENAPKIEFKEGWPQGAIIELACATAIAKVTLDPDAPSITAVIAGEDAEKTVTFILLHDQSPLKAQRVSLTPATEEKVGAHEVAAIIVEELITGAP
jgi:hypothetical protein